MAASNSRQKWCKSLIALYAVSAFSLNNVVVFKLLLFHLFFSFFVSRKFMGGIAETLEESSSAVDSMPWRLPCREHVLSAQ